MLNRMNRKGHVGTGIMVFFAALLVTYALVLMQAFNNDVSKERNEIRAIIQNSYAEQELVKNGVNSSIWAAIAIASSGEAEKKDFETAFNKAIKEVINSQRNSGINNDVYAKIANGEYSLIFQDGKYIFTVPNVFLNTKRGINSIVYRFSVEAVFNERELISISFNSN